MITICVFTFWIGEKFPGRPEELLLRLVDDVVQGVHALEREFLATDLHGLGVVIHFRGVLGIELDSYRLGLGHRDQESLEGHLCVVDVALPAGSVEAATQHGVGPFFGTVELESRADLDAVCPGHGADDLPDGRICGPGADFVFVHGLCFYFCLLMVL